MQLELSQEFLEAFSKIENTSEHLFITGKAGTGKSTLLTYFKENTKKNVVLLAPTGIAAINIGGSTIHRFFKFSIDITVERASKKRYSKEEDKELLDILENLDTIVIDEISMVRADLLDCVNEVLKNHGSKKKAPFGGIQVIFFGDLYQLPPVITRKDEQVFNFFYSSPYFFSSNAYTEINMEIIELNKIYRQKDENFINLLNKVRINTINKVELAMLNSLYQPNYLSEHGEIQLTTTNSRANSINTHELEKIKAKLFQSRAIIKGDVPKDFYPNNELLSYKKGAQIMMLKNNRNEEFVNGSIGIIENIFTSSEYDIEFEFVEIKIFESNRIVRVHKATWDIFKFELQGKKIVPVPIGSFTQYPFKLAWAVTIHKSQGNTFDNVIIDLDRGAFACGQTYVALSRCRTFEGIKLRKKISFSDVKTDEIINRFFAKYAYDRSEKNISLNEKISILKNTISKHEKIQIEYITYRNEKLNFAITPKKIYNDKLNGHKFIAFEVYNHTIKEHKKYIVEHIVSITQ